MLLEDRRWPSVRHRSSPLWSCTEQQLHLRWHRRCTHRRCLNSNRHRDLPFAVHSLVEDDRCYLTSSVWSNNPDVDRIPDSKQFDRLTCHLRRCRVRSCDDVWHGLDIDIHDSTMNSRTNSSHWNSHGQRISNRQRSLEAMNEESSFVRSVLAITRPLPISYSNDVVRRETKRHQGRFALVRARKEREIEYRDFPLILRSLTTDWAHILLHVKMRGEGEFRFAHAQSSSMWRKPSNRPLIHRLRLIVDLFSRSRRTKWNHLDKGAKGQHATYALSSLSSPSTVGSMLIVLELNNLDLVGQTIIVL